MSQPSSVSDFQSSIYGDESQLNHAPFEFNYDPLAVNRHTPEPTGSQSSLPPSEFARPSLPPRIPDHLQRVGPDSIKQYLLWTMENSIEFTAWWIHTHFGRQKKINWNGKHSAVCWDKFDQVADTRTGKPCVMCKSCKRVLDHPGSGRGGTSSMNKHISGVNCQRVSKRPNIKKALEHAANTTAPKADSFTQEGWDRSLVKLITTSRLPFQFVEHRAFQEVISIAQLSTMPLQMPSAKVIRRRLKDFVLEAQQGVLRKLPSNAKLSLALDCWTSPFQQAFMAVTGYFLDQDWQYQEVLLGFEPLSGSHSGVNLSSVLMSLLQQHNITNRVLAVTTDNASNNNTLVSSLQDSINSLEFNNNSAIIRVPCIAHVIQLSLNDLLGRMKAIPTNKIADLEWNEGQGKRSGKPPTKPSQKLEIIHTLSKIRRLAVFINASPQRRDSLFKLQTSERKLVIIQDVKTRWNSTFLMLRRAKRLQPFLEPFCKQYQMDELIISREEWRQVEYLLWITHPFYQFTTVLSQTKDVTIHLVFGIYNKLFAHLEKSTAQLKKKKVPWKKVMLDALAAARIKLSQYYGMTDDMDGDLYAIGTILSPQNKLQFFATKDWQDPDISWRDRYRKSLEDRLKTYKHRIICEEGLRPVALYPGLTEIDLMVAGEPIPTPSSSVDDELAQYLNSPTIKAAPRIFWKENEHVFPTLASLARDILSIPATGAGVERLFNSARDVCHYRRGSLKPSTIQELMMYMFTSKFNMEDEERLLIKEYLSFQEVQTEDEERDKNIYDLEPISDDEEDEEDVEDEEHEEDVEGEEFMAVEISQPNEVVLGKRRRSVATVDGGSEVEVIEDDEEDNRDLPVHRTTGRARVRSVRLKGYDTSM